jgi:hypothetical protein
MRDSGICEALTACHQLVLASLLSAAAPAYVGPGSFAPIYRLAPVLSGAGILTSMVLNNIMRTTHASRPPCHGNVSPFSSESEW